MEKNQFLISLGTRIRIIRKEKRMTQQHLSDLCEIEKANLSRIESGKTNPTILTLLKLSRSLDTDLNNFFNGQEVHAVKQNNL
jgi:transcriptional regulator with XRE-family HTH domain